MELFCDEFFMLVLHVSSNSLYLSVLFSSLSAKTCYCHRQFYCNPKFTSWGAGSQLQVCFCIPKFKTPYLQTQTFLFLFSLFSSNKALSTVCHSGILQLPGSCSKVQCLVAENPWNYLNCIPIKQLLRVYFGLGWCFLPRCCVYSALLM